jgi:hypothetical protein
MTDEPSFNDLVREDAETRRRPMRELEQRLSEQTDHETAETEENE